MGRLLAWKSSDVVAGWINLLGMTYLSLYCSDTLGVDIALVGTLLFASKIVDAFTDVFASILVDNTKSKLGKGRPYELCIVGMTLCTIALFSCSPAWSLVFKCAWIFCMYTLTFSVFTTLRQAANTPYTTRHFSNNELLIRKVASFGGIITMAGSMALSISFPMLMARIATSAAGWRTLMLAIMIPATLIGLPRFFFCKEDPAVDAKASQEPVRLDEIKTLVTKNKYVWYYAIIMLCYNVITGAAVGTYYFKWVMGSVQLMSAFSVLSIVVLPVMFVFPAIMKKLGSTSKMIMIFAIADTVAYGLVFFIGTNFTALMVLGLISAIATAPLAYYGVIRLYCGWSLSAVAGEAHAQGSGYDGERRQAAPAVAAPAMPQPGTPAMTEMLRPVLKMLFHKTVDELNQLTMPLVGANAFELEDDMLTIRKGPAHIAASQFDTPADSSFFGHAFYEASSIRKIGGRFYFIYSSENSNELCYSVSDYPDKDFVYGGTIISNGDVGYKGLAKQDRTNMTANDHGSLENINGQWYIFHHRQTYRSTFSRQACAEKVTILPDGSIPQVECTSMGFNPGPLAAAGTYPAPISCILSNGRMPHATNTKVDADIPYITDGDSMQFITDIKEGTKTGYKYFALDGPVTFGVTYSGSANGVFEVWNEQEKLTELPAPAAET